MAIRLKDIARDLNVSVITVSKALRGNTDISDATRQRVLRRMKELDYQPNMMARSLATGQSFFLGLIVPDLLNPFMAELARSLAVALRQQSYGLIVASSEESPEIEQSEIRMMLARGVDALLLASCQPLLQGFYSFHHQNDAVRFARPPLPSPPRQLRRQRRLRRWPAGHRAPAATRPAATRLHRQSRPQSRRRPLPRLS